jgi:hypothetical protein
MAMRMRADQVRVGHRLGGAVVTRVQPTLDWGVVRITVEHQPDAGESAQVPDGTFSYLPDDIVDVQRPAPSGAYAGSPAGPATFAGATQAVSPPNHDGGDGAQGRRATTQEVAYRVEYQAVTGDGHIVVRADDSVTTSMVGRAHDLLEQQGIDARIRRIVPLDREPVAGRPAGRVKRLS